MPPSKAPKAGQTDDLATLDTLDDKILLNELKVRYKSNNIYSYVGDILVAINPFQPLPLYTEKVATTYNGAAKSSTKPHVYAIADQAFNSMMKSGKNQCVVVSGESGAGKTESARANVVYRM